MSYPGARSRAAAPLLAGDVLELPLDPATGWLAISGTVMFVPLPAMPVTVIYSTAGVGEASSFVPAAAPPAALLAIYAHLISAAAASRWIQIHLGPVFPLAGATPFLVGDIITPAGGNTQFVVPEELDRSTGFYVVLSTTQDTFTTPAVAELVTRALGR